jgi:hypothetical protein
LGEGREKPNIVIFQMDAKWGEEQGTVRTILVQAPPEIKYRSRSRATCYILHKHVYYFTITKSINMSTSRRSGRHNQTELPFSVTVQPATASSEANLVQNDLPDDIEDALTPSATSSLRVSSRDASPLGLSVSSRSISSRSRKRRRATTEEDIINAEPKRSSWVYHYMLDPDPNTIY